MLGKAQTDEDQSAGQRHQKNISGQKKYRRRQNISGHDHSPPEGPAETPRCDHLRDAVRVFCRVRRRQFDGERYQMDDDQGDRKKRQHERKTDIEL